MKTKKSVKRLLSLITSSAMIFTLTSALPEQRNVAAANTVVIDINKEYQTIRGFGGIDHPEWTGRSLSESERQTAFGNGDNELGLTVLRVFVNPDKNQWNLALPTAQFATKMGATVFASPWEPPANLAESGGSNGKLHIPKSNYAAYAEHLNSFGQYMKDNGVDLYSISVQNEPDFAEDWTYWSTDETTDFIANYGDKITSTRLMSPESFQYAPENASWVPDGGKKFYRKILNNAKAMANCDVFGTHMYGTARSWMDFPDLENSGKEIWMTEVYVPNSEADSANRWPESVKVAQNIHNAMVVGNMSAYTWWYIRRSYGLMTEDGKISKRGYCMAQYSKYVRPGAVRVDATELPEGEPTGKEENAVYVSAYKGDNNQVTIVAVNATDTEYTENFKVDGASISDVDRYRTSASENIAPTLNMDFNGDNFYAQLPANSVSTFVVTLSGGSVGPVEPIEPNEYGWYFADGFEGDTCDWNIRGSGEAVTSGRTSYVGDESLLVKDRTAAWNGASKTLNPKAFTAGNEYSFSANVMYYDGEPTDKFYLKLQYADANGDTQYSTIAEATAIKGEWVQLANKNYKIPDGATNMQIYVETAESTNNFYIDEVIGAIAGTSILGAGESKNIILGDINSDGVINSFDMILARNGLINGFSESSEKLSADVDQNGEYNISDAVLIQKFILGQINEFPVSEPVTPPTPPSSDMLTMSEYTPTVQAKVSEFETADSKQEKAGVQYGTVKSGTYYSTTCNRNKPYNILLPANYNENKKYPVLYVLHGYWENQDRMIIEGNDTMYTRQIIGNAIAEGEAEDMIVVFPYVYSSATQDACSGMNDENNAAYDNFINDLTKDLMPHIESTYSVKTGRENTAITGFSMGGRESLLIGMQRADLFGYVGAICPAPGVTGSFKWNSEKEAPSLLFITAGSNDTIVYSNPENYHNNFAQNNVPHIWHYVNGGYHGDNSIHAHIYNFVRAVFKA